MVSITVRARSARGGARTISAIGARGALRTGLVPATLCPPSRADLCPKKIYNMKKQKQKKKGGKGGGGHLSSTLYPLIPRVAGPAEILLKSQASSSPFFSPVQYICIGRWPTRGTPVVLGNLVGVAYHTNSLPRERLADHAWVTQYSTG
jgi:hypothetical protein